MAPRLELLDPNERALPGRFLLTDVHSTGAVVQGKMEDYWPALVLDKALAPSKVEQAQQFPVVLITNDEYLIWLIGKGRFFWANQAQLYQPHKSQLDALKGAETEVEFKSIFDIGMNNDATQMLELFSDEIMEDATRISGGKSMLRSERQSGSGSSRRGLKRELDQPPLGRNLRAASGMSSFQSRSSSPSTRNTSAISGTPSTEQEEAPTVKQEDDLLPRKDRVRVFVGINNIEFTSSKVNIAKSPVLSGYVQEHNGQQSFIMHPDLKDVKSEDFKHVIDFLRTEKYAPALVDAPLSRSDPRKFDLAGLNKDNDNDHLLEIQRCGRLHVLAKTFQIPAMVDYVFQRLTQVRHKSAVFNNAVVLGLTSTVFASGMQSESCRVNQETVGQEDALEAWLITKIVENLENITTWHGTSALFWVVMHAGKARNLSAKIFERRAQLDRKLPGFIKVEDD